LAAACEGKAALERPHEAITACCSWAAGEARSDKESEGGKVRSWWRRRGKRRGCSKWSLGKDSAPPRAGACHVGRGSSWSRSHQPEPDRDALEGRAAACLDLRRCPPLHALHLAHVVRSAARHSPGAAARQRHALVAAIRAHALGRRASVRRRCLRAVQCCRRRRTRRQPQASSGRRPQRRCCLAACCQARSPHQPRSSAQPGARRARERHVCRPAAHRARRRLDRRTQARRGRRLAQPHAKGEAGESCKRASHGD
jgi:hypothetical protein